MVELDEKLLDKARKGIEKSLERVGKKQFKDEESKITGFVKESMDRISGSTDLSTVVKDTDIVIEAIVENLEVKQKLFSSIDGVRIRLRIFKINFIIIIFRSPNLRQSLPVILHPFRSTKSPKEHNV